MRTRFFDLYSVPYPGKCEWKPVLSANNPLEVLSTLLKLEHLQVTHIIPRDECRIFHTTIMSANTTFQSIKYEIWCWHSKCTADITHIHLDYIHFVSGKRSAALLILFVAHTFRTFFVFRFFSFFAWKIRNNQTKLLAIMAWCVR